MARLTTAQRTALPISDFAVPSKAPGPGSYPMPDAAHAAVAKSLAAQHASPAVQKKVATKAKKKLGPPKGMAPARQIGRPAQAVTNTAKHHAAATAAYQKHMGR